MKPIASIVVFLLLTFNGIAQHEKFSFDKNWRFHKGDVPIEFTPTAHRVYTHTRQLLYECKGRYGLGCS